MDRGAWWATFQWDKESNTTKDPFFKKKQVVILLHTIDMLLGALLLIFLFPGQCLSIFMKSGKVFHIRICPWISTWDPEIMSWVAWVRYL